MNKMLILILTGCVGSTEMSVNYPDQAASDPEPRHHAHGLLAGDGCDGWTYWGTITQDDFYKECLPDLEQFSTVKDLKELAERDRKRMLDYCLEIFHGDEGYTECRDQAQDAYREASWRWR